MANRGNRQENANLQSTPLFLGFDLSTQQLKAIVLEPINQRNDHSTAFKTHSLFSVHFDKDLAHYNTRGGVTIQHDTGDDDSENRGVVTTPVLMWVEALSLILGRMKEDAFPFGRVQAISGAAQQHGSVYWSSGAQEAFSIMETSSDRDSSLKDIFKDAFTVYQSPIWQDTSTTAQCREIEEYLGRMDLDKNKDSNTAETYARGQQRLAELTGSRAYERFTGNQILKLVQKNPDVYNATKRISLVSSFLASLLMGQYAKIDAADGSGMNMLNIESKTWDPLLTSFIGKGGFKNQNINGTLEERLGEVEASGRKVQGVISKWFVERYGFRSDVKIVTFTGDNPATIMAMQAEQGDAIVSLGTSDTLLLYTNHHGQSPSLTDEPNSANQANARLSVGYLCHPVDPNGYLMMYCAKNGSLAREKVRDLYADGDWDQFDKSLENAMRSEQHSRFGFYFFDREIWPPVKGVYRFQDSQPVDEFETEDGDDGKRRANVGAICESQFLTMRLRSSQQAPSKSESSPSSSLSPPGISRILATGGASSNRTILQLLSNVFGVPVVSTSDSGQKGAGSAGWGAARKAFLFGYHESSAQKDNPETNNVHEKKTEEGEVILPDLEKTKEYVNRISEFTHLEKILLQRSSDSRQ
ncbi:hypothetical protein BGZ49_002534 [Haplosporangium sp. Z 27]|nr:hypothetical protein BGZ49_002534 [Haplosporangium sp. Z 27]